MGAVKNMPRALAFFEFDTRAVKIAEMQAYAGPLAWLENNVSNNLLFGQIFQSEVMYQS